MSVDPELPRAVPIEMGAAAELIAPLEPANNEIITHVEPGRLQRLGRWGVSVAERTKEVALQAREDVVASEHPRRLIAVGAGTLAVQGADRLRMSVVIVPTVAVNVLQNTHSSLEAAVAGGFVFGGWCTAVGGMTTEGLYLFPRATRKAEENFPAAVNFFEDSLPGLESPQNVEQRSRLRRAGARLLTGVKRGFTVSGIGTTAYASTAAVRGRPKAETHKLNLNASLDGAAAVGAIVLGAGEAIVQLSHDNPALAERIQHDASNIKLWYGVAGAMIVQTFVTNKFKQWRNRRSAEEQPVAAIDS